MARRTRRDLSNKQIRKIVQKQIKDKPFRTNARRISILKPMLYLVAIAVFILIVLQIYGLLQSGKIFSQPENGLTTQRQLPDQWEEPAPVRDNHQKPDTSRTNQQTHPVVHQTQIEILNGCGANGIAAIATQFSRNNHLDVVYMGNHDIFTVKKSTVISRNGDQETARKIAAILGIGEDQVQVKIDRSKQLAASVILGADYQTLLPFKEN